jgi:LPXTG-site transpeptidase (sortase) family protein
MKKRWLNLLLLFVFLIGFSLLLYPTVSNYLNEKNQSRAITNYEGSLSVLTKEDYTAFLKDAEAYNQKLSGQQNPIAFAEADAPEYQSLLDPLKNGIMGYVEMDSIGVKLPIYHGTSDAVLEVGAGHLEGSSLPVGGKSTHCVLSGHRGLPSAKLFTDLDKLSVGDVFQLHVLDRVLAYQVNQIVTVEPKDTSNLQIVDGMDYCTLVTCTPYGINSHRLLVRGVRVDYAEKAASSIDITADATIIDLSPAMPVIAALLLSVLFAGLLISTRHKRKSKKEGCEP